MHNLNPNTRLHQEGVLAAVAQLESLLSSEQGEALSTGYAEQLGELATAAETAELHGLQDACLLMQERVGGVGTVSTEAEREWLIAWPGLVRDYLQLPDDPHQGEALVRHLADDRWPSPLAAADADMLRSLLAAVGSDSEEDDPLAGSGLTVIEGEEPEALAPVAPADGSREATGSLSASSLDAPGPASAELLGVLDQLEAVSAGSEGEELLASYTAQLGRLAAAAEASELHGLQDACLLHEERLSGLSEVSSAAERELLAAWPRLVRVYLQTPGDGRAIEALLQHLSDARWPAPLAEVDAEMLRSLLAMEPSGADDADPLAGSGLTVFATDEGATGEPGSADSAGLEATVPLSEALPASRELNIADPVPSPLTTGQALEAFAELTETQTELRDLLLAELAPMGKTLDDALAVAASDRAAQSDRREAMRGSADHVQRFGDAADAAGFRGLQRVCAHLQENLGPLSENASVAELEETQLLVAWGDRVGGYLKALGTRQSSEELLSHLEDARWPRPLAAVERSELVGLLDRVPPGAEEEEEPPEVVVTAEDVSLEISQRVDPQVLESLLQELPGQTEAFSAVIQRMGQGVATVEDLQTAQRVAHTVKGAANTVGIRGVATLTHRLEDVLLSLAKHAVLPSTTLAESLVKAADCLETMSEALTGVGEPPADALDVVQEVIDWRNRIAREGIGAAQRGEPATALAGNETDAASAPQPPAPAPRPTTATLRVPAPLVDSMLRLSGETIILTGQVHERVNLALVQAGAMRDRLALTQQLGQELEQFIDLRDISALKEQSPSGDVFDPLEFDRYNELHTYSRRLMEATTDAREAGQMLQEHLAALDAMLVNQERLNRDSQGAVLDTRMVSAQTIVSRLQRAVRQTCRLTGKQAQLEVQGAETLVDSDVLNQLVDPLMHLLRNAVDHGIEVPEERRRLGKHESGRITLEFVRDGNYVVVICWDDGAGLDLEAIRHVAEERGMLTSEQLVPESELQRYVLRPNFSTREHATQTSGRGIGMDAVYTRVLELSGSMDMESAGGQGLRIALRLPVTLISTHALLVQLGEFVVGVSARGVQHILHAGDGELRDVGTELMYQVGEDVFPVRRLTSLLGTYSGSIEEDNDAGAVLIIRGDDGPSAVLVEKVLDTRDLVVKSMGQYVPKLKGMIGATILGDGSVTPVLDVPELLRSQLVDERALPSDTETPQPAQARSVLVVDDSLSARRSLAQFAEDTGFRVLTARDGLEAVPIIEEQRPDVLLVDLEMPRMNGLELTRHVRARETTASLPVIMVTSRSTGKHRREAEAAGVDVYLTKPFSEDELLKHLADLGGAR